MSASDNPHYLVNEGSPRPTALFSLLGTLTVMTLIIVIGVPISAYLGYVMLTLSAASSSESHGGSAITFFQKAAEIGMAAAAPTVAAVILLPSRSPVRRYLMDRYGSGGAGGDGKALPGSREDKILLYRRYFPNLFSHLLDRLPDRISQSEYDRDLFRIQIYTNGATVAAQLPPPPSTAAAKSTLDEAEKLESLRKDVQEYAVAEVRKRLERKN
jgi:hypothetical protein